MNSPRIYAVDHREKFLAELIEFLRIPSVSTQPEHFKDVSLAAAWLAEAMKNCGLENVRLVPTSGHPLVYGDWLHTPDAPTVLIYGHYDVQPPAPLALWETPPFKPEVRDDYLYARGAADDKGQIFIHIKAVESFMRADGRPPVNLKFIVEGEEECGGAGLAAFLPENVDFLQADVALISDTAMVSKEQPAIVYGLRGLCYAQLDLQGPRRDLHSGSFGGGIDNPLNVLGHIITKLKDEKGRVLIPGFYERVRSLTSRERELLAEYPLDENAWLAEAGSPVSWGEPEYTLVERIGARPTLDIHGIIGGYTESGRKTVLPAVAHMKFSMRLVPDQNPVEIQQLLSAYLEEIIPPSVTYELQFSKGSKASITNLDIPAMKAAEEAYAQVFGRKPVYMREGGSIPVVSAFQSVLGLETVLMGFGLPTDQIHAPNERFYLPNFYKGIETSIRFMQLFRAMASI